MNIGFWMCMVLVPAFAVMALIFNIGKEWACGLISGFNALPREEQALYDRARMAKDTAKDLTVWTVIMLLGAACSMLISQYAAFYAYVIWLVLFFKDLHLDARKAYRKYLLK